MQTIHLAQVSFETQDTGCSSGIYCYIETYLAEVYSVHTVTVSCTGCRLSYSLLWNSLVRSLMIVCRFIRFWVLWQLLVWRRETSWVVLTLIPSATKGQFLSTSCPACQYEWTDSSLYNAFTAAITQCLLPQPSALGFACVCVSVCAYESIEGE